MGAPSLAAWSGYCIETNVRDGCRQERTPSATAVPVDRPEGSHSYGAPSSQEQGTSTPHRDPQPTAIETGRRDSRGPVVGISGVPTCLPGPESALSEGSASIAAAPDWRGHHMGLDCCRGYNVAPGPLSATINSGFKKSSVCVEASLSSLERKTGLPLLECTSSAPSLHL